MRAEVTHSGLGGLRKRLTAVVQEAGSYSRAAVTLGVANSLLCDVVNGKRRPPPALLCALGFERRVVRHYIYAPRHA